MADAEVKFRDDMTVQLVDYMGNDQSIIRAMLVSTQGEEALGREEDKKRDSGRINFLMKNRHGTPFEHNSMTFYIEAPIFVFREFHRHRIGWSYNEMSGRYKELEPVFYVPNRTRPLVQEGKPGAYEFIPGSEEQYLRMMFETKTLYHEAFRSYQLMLYEGIAKEVARTVLPVGIYSSMFATCNARSLMAFLSLRTKSEIAKFPSYPQREIEMVAEEMEAVFQQLFPITWDAFDRNGRVAP
jgi:thymidylate synthase (FAD)